MKLLTIFCLRGGKKTYFRKEVTLHVIKQTICNTYRQQDINDLKF